MTIRESVGPGGRSMVDRSELDLEHPGPCDSKALREVELVVDLSHFFARYVGPDIFPLGVAQEMGNGPRASLSVALREDLEQLFSRDFVFWKEIESGGGRARHGVTSIARSVIGARCSARSWLHLASY